MTEEIPPAFVFLCFANGDNIVFQHSEIHHSKHPFLANSLYSEISNLERANKIMFNLF